MVRYLLDEFLALFRKARLFWREVRTCAAALVAVEHLLSQYEGARPTPQVRDALLRDLDSVLWSYYRQVYPGYAPNDLYWVEIDLRDEGIDVHVWLRGFPGGRAREWLYRV